MKVGFAATSTSLTGIIEVDEAYFGGKEHNKHMSKRMHGDRGLPQKMAVVGMRERGKDGRTKAQPISPVSRITLERVVRLNVESGSVVNTDEATSYRGWVKHNYTHNTINHNDGEYVSKGASTNSIESVWAVMKRGMHGVYHHASKKHLSRYVDEFTWRLNEGNVKRHSLERLNSFVDAVAGKRITYKALTA